jgi:hypothetical protein
MRFRFVWTPRSAYVMIGPNRLGCVGNGPSVGEVATRLRFRKAFACKCYLSEDQGFTAAAFITPCALMA